MLLLDNVISQDEIDSFKDYFQTNYQKRYVNWVQDNQTIDYRLNIDDKSDLFEIIRRIASKNIPDYIDLWSAYQRQSKPHNIHIDDYGHHKGLHRYTYILAMDTVPEFKSIIWKQTCWNNDALHEFVAQWGRLKKYKKKTSSISETEDLEHTFDHNQQDYMCDYLDLDGIYTYKTGTACLFQATQLHCTSNWHKYKKFPYRELLQIHVTSEDPIQT